MQEPIELTRELTQELTQFYSKELQVPCGYHSGFLLVDNKKHDLEDIQVKNYMFEIDLYIKDGKLIGYLTYKYLTFTKGQV